MQDCNRDWFWKALWLYKRQSRGNGKKKRNETGENRRKNGEAEHESKQKKTQGR
jgi:hypothetical protein